MTENQLLLSLALLGGSGFVVCSAMNDVSGLIGTLCASRATSLFRAQWMAIVGAWLGLLLGPNAVSQTVATGLVDLTHVSVTTALTIWLSAVSGALAWVLLARRVGIPTSSTHSLVGSLCGAAWLGTGHLDLRHGITKVVLGLVLSPLMGATLGFLTFRLLALVLHRRHRSVSGALRGCERAAVFLQCVAYGMNDAQAGLGLLKGACLSAGLASSGLALKLGIGCALTLGALLGSMKIMRTMARGLYHVRPPEALAAQSAAALAVFLAVRFGAPVSSSQVTSSALVGVGGAWRPRHVRWRKAGEIAVTWGVTFPCALAFGGLLCGAVLLLEWSL